MRNTEPAGKNLIWIILDGMRAAKDSHEKARFESFDATASRGAFFQKVIAPAPSTIMSLLSFLTGSPSYAILPDFFSSLMPGTTEGNLEHTGDSEITIDRQAYPTLLDGLDRAGVRAGIASYYPPLRAFMRGLGVATRPDETPGSESSAYEWTNEEVLEHAKKMFLANRAGQRFFLIIHYVVRHGIDRLFSDTVSFLDEQGFFDNGILLFCPDHGFYSVSYSEQIVKRSLQHDADAGAETVITVGGLVGKGITPQVQTANVWGPDLLFTAFDLAGIFPDELKDRYDYGARSYSRSIAAGEGILTRGRAFRFDTRFARQPGGVTVIVRDDLLWQFDQTTGNSRMVRWEFDIEQGIREFEVESTPETRQADQELRDEFENSQRSVLAYGGAALKSYDPLPVLQANLRGDLVHLFEGHTYKHTLGIDPKDARVLVFRSFPMEFFVRAAGTIGSYFTPNLVDVICDSTSAPSVESCGLRTFCYGEGMVTRDSLFTRFPEMLERHYDICLAGYNLMPLEGYANIFEILDVLKPRFTCLISTNGCLYPIEDYREILQEIAELRNVRQRYRELFYKYGRGNAL